jgi:hypothetical protein
MVVIIRHACQTNVLLVYGYIRELKLIQLQDDAILAFFASSD